MSLYHGEDQSSRFSLLDRPMQLPGICAVCGSPNNKCVDFGLQIEWYGAVYICVVCLNAAAEKAGLYEAREIGVALNNAFQDGWLDLASNLGEIKEAENDIIAGIGRFNNIVNMLLGLRNVPFEVSADDSGSEPKQSAYESESDSTNGQDVSVIDVEGSSGISSDTSNESGDTNGEPRVPAFTI